MNFNLTEEQNSIKELDNELANNYINISLDVFTGPLDALYSLVIKKKIDLESIPISSITSQILTYFNDNKDVELSGEMMILVSRLLYLKSSYILSKHRKLEELSLEEEEIARQIKEKLEEYSKYKIASEILYDRLNVVNKSYFRHAPEIITNEYFSSENLTLQEINLTLRRMNDLELESLIKHRNLNTTDEKLNDICKSEFIRVEDQIEKLKTVLDKQTTVKLSECTKNESKQGKIAMFLGVLEMCKSKDVLVEQEYAYSEILITKKIKEIMERNSLEITEF